MLNIVDAIEAQITPVQVERISAMAGQPQVRTRQAMSTGILAILGGVIHQTSSPAGAASVLGVLRSPIPGMNLTTALLGDRAELVTNALGRSTGLSGSASSGLIGALLPMVATVLGREVASRNLDAGGLAELMRSQRQHLLGRPGMAGLAGMLGANEVGGMDDVLGAKARATPLSVMGAPLEPEPPRHPHVPSPVHHARMARHSRSWLPMAIAVGVLAIGAIFLARKSTPPTTESPIAGAPEEPMLIEQPEVDRPPLAPVPPLEHPSETTITSAEIPAGTDLAVHFDAKDLPDKITLEGVTFDFATTKLTSGEDTVEKLAASMRAHPTTRVRIEGHTDDVGTAATNDSLSLKRATAVKQLLIDKGIDGARIDAVGRGGHDPVAPNDTDQNRAKNRRIEVVIVER